MSSSQQNEIVIHGTTSSGRVFRPSDWAERLCGILSSFNKDNRLAYHEWVRPVLLNKVRCVTIDVQLQEINPAMFRFLMDFAADNDLRVMTAEEVALLDRQPEKENTDKHNIESQTAQNHPVEEVQQLLQMQPETPTDNYILREIAPNEIASAFAALSVLRPALTDINRFVEQVNMMQRKQGYRLLGIFEEGKSSAVAVCGFREKTDLSSGHQLHVDDIVTIPQYRRRGYATLLLNEVRKIAMQMDIPQVHADCLVGTERTIAHRMYFQNGFEILSHHFICKI